MVKVLLENCRRDSGSSTFPNLFSWELGEIATGTEGCQYKVVLALAGHAGTITGSLATYITVSRWRPRYVFFVGIAGGFERNDCTKGDVLLSDVIWGYEYGKLARDFKPRHDLTYRCDGSLLNGALTFNSNSSWAGSIRTKRPGREQASKPKVIPGPIASGDKVIDDPTNEFFEQVINAYNTLQGVEMEGVGAAAAIAWVQSEGKPIGFMMIRGVSDMPRPASETLQPSKSATSNEREKWKRYAADVAASFTVQYIKSGLPIPPLGLGGDAVSETTLTSRMPTGIIAVATGSDQGRLTVAKTINVRLCINDAIEAIVGCQNDDGGIAATEEGEGSGAWTTASCLEALLLCKYTPLTLYSKCKDMAKFLLDKQVEDGGWPFVNSDTSSTMSTGHTVTALMLFQNTFPGGEINTRINKATKDGLCWLDTYRNDAKVWGVEPAAGARESRIISTYYALRPFWLLGQRHRSSRLIRETIEFITRRQAKDGGFPFIRGTVCNDYSCSSNTARVLTAIIRSGCGENKLQLVTDALKFLRSQRIGMSWKPSLEGFYADASHGQNVVHNNSPCDVVEALIWTLTFLAEPNDAKIMRDGILWLIETQKENGFWELTSPDTEHHDFVSSKTWPTSEFIYVISLALQKHGEDLFV